MSETLLELYADSDIKNSYKSDHSPINLTLNISKHKRGWGNWKLNNSLLLDNEFKSKVEDEIELIISTYACTPYHPEFVKKNYKDFDFELMIEIDLLWEVLNIQLRGLMMSLASNKKRKQNSEENKLSKEIKVLEETLKDNLNNNGWINELKEKNDQLEEIREHKLKGALIRSRWQQSNMREKPSNFFFNLENKNYISKHIRELKIDNKIIQDPKQILEEMRLFYEKLYTGKNNIELEQSSLSHFKDKINKISDKEKEDLEKKITMSELELIIKKSKNNKSPGPDGFTNEFYKIFWHNIKKFLLKLLNHYRENIAINPSQLEGTITCILKGGKIRNNLKNSSKFNI